MQAHQPAELPLVFRDHLNAGNLAGLMADYYAPDATYAPVPGVVLAARRSRRPSRASSPFGAPIEVTVRHVLEAGDTALLVVDWELPDAGMSGTATDVARRQPDGTWRCVIDNPHGGARTVELRPDIAAALAG